MSERGHGRPERVGDLLAGAARSLGLDEELRLARAMTTWDAIVEERCPAAAGACRLLRLDGAVLVVEADHPIVAQELRLAGPALLEAFASAPGGGPAGRLHVDIRRR